MDYIRIIKKDGYTYKDMSQENQHVMDYLRYFEKDINEGFSGLYLEKYDEESLIHKMCLEVAEDVLAELEGWMSQTLASYQVSMIEAQDESDV